MEDKVIVTHRGALLAKYESSGLKQIRVALKALMAADRKRGIKTRLIFLDGAKAMAKLGAEPVESPSDCRAAKTAIDRIFVALNPDYLMILGAPDVVPQQDLDNPIHAAFGGGDGDSNAWGDLPYACESTYSRDPAKFVGPTRVVGRLPDLRGASEPSHLIKLLETAAGWTQRPAADYTAYFGLTAEVWKGSTRLSLDNIFGHNAALRLAPPSGPAYPAGELAARMHFINCHGGEASPEFYGQQGQNYPVTLTTKTTAAAIQDGTVTSVECCYGAELYDSVTLGIDVPICQSYLQQGAYGYFGSTTIAYGPAEGNGAADLICQYFLLNVLNGASTGRAALMARQQFVQGSAQMDPVDLKTLAQFCLYGDPSVHPVAGPEGSNVPSGATRESSERFRRSERRATLKLAGEFLQRTKPTASKQERGIKPSTSAKTALANIAERGGLPRNQTFQAFAVSGAKAATRGAKAASVPSRYYLAIGVPEGEKDAGGYTVAVVAKELGGRIIDYRIYHER